MSGSVQKAIPDVREALSDVRECSEGPPGCPGVVVSISRMSRSGSKPLLDIREGLPDIWEGFPTTLGHSAGSPDHFRTTGRVSRPLPYIR